MSNILFEDTSSIQVQAFFVGQRIDLKMFEKTHVLAKAPLVVRAGTQGYAVLFRYGVVVLFGMDAVEQVSFLAELKHLVVEPFDTPESESTVIVVDEDHGEGIRDGEICLHYVAIPHLQLVADILGKTVVLAHYESILAQSFEKIEPMALELKSKGRSGRKARDFLDQIGQTLLIQGKVIGRVEVDEKPDLLWDRPELDRLFSRLRDEFELKERHRALMHKLDLIFRTAETMLALLQDRRSFHVEWYIVFLILFEIIISLYELFIHPHYG